MEDDVSRTPKTKKKKIKSDHIINIRFNLNWVIFTIILTFSLSVLISFVTTSLLGDVGMGVAVFVLLVIISIGIFFDIIGIAVTAANEIPFHAMASNRVYGAKSAIRLIRSAEKVSNICNDVVGDICGIISGATATIIITGLHERHSAENIFISLGITGLVAALTVGGKAAGKSFGISRCNEIMFTVGKILCLFNKDNAGRKG
jgi:hypothetical protein